MEVAAIGKYLKISPRKLLPVAALVKKKKAVDALVSLRFVNKKGAKIVRDVLKSAISNAKNNFKLTENNLMIKKIEVQKGPMLKRFQPVSRGRAHPILKRMSHLRIVLEASDEQKNKQVENEVQTVNKTANRLPQMANRKKEKTISDKPKAISAAERSK